MQLSFIHHDHGMVTIVPLINRSPDTVSKGYFFNHNGYDMPPLGFGLMLEMLFLATGRTRTSILLQEKSMEKLTIYGQL